MPRFEVLVRLVIEAEDTNEAHRAGYHLAPKAGPMQGGAQAFTFDGGDVATVVDMGIAGVRPVEAGGFPAKHALLIDANDVRDEVQDDIWTDRARLAVEDFPWSETNDLLVGQFGGDFWAAMHDTYAEVIDIICQEAGVPDNERRTVA